MDNDLKIQQAKQQARSDMRDAEPHNPYPFRSEEYWAYANEVDKAFTEDLERVI